MSMNVRFGCLFGLAILLGGMAGCGAGDYKERLEARVERLKTESPFNDLGAPVALGDTGVTVRLPKLFGDPPQACADVSRIPVLGLERVVDKAAFGYETMLASSDEEDAEKMACSLRFWVRSGERSGDMAGILSSWVRDTYPENGEKSKEVSLRSEGGFDSSWRMAAGEGKEQFLCTVDGQEASQELDGRTAGYLFKTPGLTFQVFMTVRAPKVLWEKYNLKKLAEQTAGSVVIKKDDAAQ